MVGILLVWLGLLRAVWRGVREDREFRGLLVAALALIAIGTAFYVNVEDLSVVDAVYFCVIILTTVGLGDITPQTEAGKIFTTGFVLVGFGVIAGFARNLVTRRMERVDERRRRRSEG